MVREKLPLPAPKEPPGAEKPAGAAENLSASPAPDQLKGLVPRAAAAQVRLALERAGCPDADWDARELCRLVTGRDCRLDERPLDKAGAARLAELTRRRAAREPLQYLAGRWSFLNLELAVGPGVLIPRADTETVCLAAAETLRGLEAPRVLELCSGSGCLALGIRSLCPAARVTALEKSSDAWPYLTRNLAEAAQKGLSSVTAVQGDVFAYQTKLADESFELIVSNPPYLTAAEMQQLQPEVAREPAMALWGGEDGLRFYRHIAAAYRTKLVLGGTLAFEVGWQQAPAVSALLEQEGYEAVRTAPDWEGRARAVLAKRGKKTV